MRVSRPEGMARMDPSKSSPGNLSGRCRGLETAHGRRRTLPADGRTFFACLPAVLACIVAGVIFVRFFGHHFTVALGWLLIPVGIHPVRQTCRAVTGSEGC